MPETYDIAVFGATAAGYVSAITLARMGRSVAVVDAPGSPVESPLADWLPADLLADCPVVKGVRSAGMEGPFRSFCFHSADGQRHTVWRQRSVAGYVVRSQRLLEALNRTARSEGVDVRVTTGSKWPELGETSVTVSAGKRAVRAKLLLIAKDSPMHVLTALRLPTRATPEGGIAVCGLDAPLPRGSIRKELTEVIHVVAVEGVERLGVFFAAGGVLHMRVISGRGSDPVKASDLSALIARCQECGLLPAKLNLSRVSAGLWRPPGGVALDLETLLAKRTLLVGTAGGFASAVVGQTLDASIRSAMVAADVAGRALDADQPQDVLAEYKAQWRDALADRIRPTGTSIQMLMPMVLTNRAMTERFAKTLLSGQNL